MDLAGSNSHYTSAHCSGQVPRSHGNWQAVNLLNHQSVIEGSYIRVYIYIHIYIYLLYIYTHTTHYIYIYISNVSYHIFFLKKKKNDWCKQMICVVCIIHWTKIELSVWPVCGLIFQCVILRGWPWKQHVAQLRLNGVTMDYEYVCPRLFANLHVSDRLIFCMFNGV